jgi:hypothetical protein
MVQDLHVDRVEVLEFDAAQLQDQLQDQLHRDGLRADILAIDPGPEQRVQKIDEFLAGLTP